MLQNQSGLAFGVYQLLRPVGWGGMSVVYQGLKAAPESDMLAPGNVTEVAVKVMSTNKEDSLSFYRRFQREVRVASALSHPHILPVCDYGIANDQLYLVMPYMQYGTLEHRIKEQKSLSLNETLAIATQIGMALDHAHTKNIVHRDVKPHNIMIGGEHQYYLADFGLVKILDGSTRITMSGHIIGTPAYMSPEQANGDPLDHRTDLYSFGIVLYECLVGRLPYPFETQAQAIGQHLSADAIRPRSLNPDFPKDVEKVLMRALHKDPARRYQAAADLVSALQKATAKCQPAMREVPLVTPEQIQRSRSEEVSHARVTVRSSKGYTAMWGVVAGIILTLLSFAALWQLKVIKPEIMLAVIIQEVEKAQTFLKQELFFPADTLSEQPVEEIEVSLPQRPILIRLDEGKSESPSAQSDQEDESASADDDTDTPLDEAESDDDSALGVNEPAASKPDTNTETTDGKTGTSQPTGSQGGNGNGNGNGNATSNQGNGSTNGNGNGTANGNGNGATNGNGAAGQGNGNGNGSSADTGNGNGAGTTDGGNGNGAAGQGNGNGTDSSTQSTDGGTSDSTASNDTNNNGNGNGNANGNGNGGK